MERRQACQDILSIDRWPRLPRPHHLSPHDGAEGIAVSHQVEDTEHPQIASSTVPITTTESPVPPAPSEGPSTSAATPQHISISAQDFLKSLVERMASTEATVAQNHASLMQLQGHLGLPPIPSSVCTQAFSTVAAVFPPVAPQPAPNGDTHPPAMKRYHFLL